MAIPPIIKKDNLTKMLAARCKLHENAQHHTKLSNTTLRLSKTTENFFTVKTNHFNQFELNCRDVANRGSGRSMDPPEPQVASSKALW